jgi:hypothetical protein
VHPVAHAALGALCFGPVGAVASLLPDAPLVAVWFVSKRNRLWLPRVHWTLRLQAAAHALWILPIVCAGAALVRPAWVVPASVSWLLHILTDYLTHSKEERWPLL